MELTTPSSKRALPVDFEPGAEPPPAIKSILSRYNSAGLWTSVKDRIVQALPESNSVDVEDLKKEGLALWISLANLTLYVGVLLYFVSTLTVAKSEQKYLSLTTPDPAEATCETIPLAVNGKFSVDNFGAWNTDPQYVSTAGVYYLQLDGTLLSNSKYQTALGDFSTWLKGATEKSSLWDYVSTLSAWGLLARTDKGSNLKFSPFADLVLLAKGAQINLFAATSYSLCESPEAIVRSSSIDPSFRLSFQNPCPKLTSLGNGEKFSIDLHSVFLAFALNMGIVDISDMIVVYENQDLFTIYNSPLYPEMFGVACNQLKDLKQRVCVAFLSSDTVAYPILSTADANLNVKDLWNQSAMPQPCECALGSNYFCNAGSNLVLSLFSFRGNGDQIGQINAKLKKQNIGHSQLRDELAPIGYSSLVAAAKNDSQLASQALSHLNDTLGANCTMLTFAVFIAPVLNAGGATLSNLAPADAPVLTHEGSPSIKKTACSNTLYRQNVLDKITTEPPVALVQPYYSCHATTLAALTTALGVAAGNSALVASLFLAATLFLIPNCFKYKSMFKWRGAKADQVDGSDAASGSSSGEPKFLPPAVKRALALEAESVSKAALQQQVAQLSAAAALDHSEKQQLRVLVNALSRRTERLETALDTLLQRPRDVLATDLIPIPIPTPGGARPLLSGPSSDLDGWALEASDSASSGSTGSPLHRRL